MEGRRVRKGEFVFFMGIDFCEGLQRGGTDEGVSVSPGTLSGLGVHNKLPEVPASATQERCVRSHQEYAQKVSGEVLQVTA